MFSYLAESCVNLLDLNSFDLHHTFPPLEELKLVVELSNLVIHYSTNHDYDYSGEEKAQEEVDESWMIVMFE